MGIEKKVIYFNGLISWGLSGYSVEGIIEWNNKTKKSIILKLVLMQVEYNEEG